MTETPRLALALLAGTLLCALFFGGLWWTVRKGLASQQPALWFFVSSPLRMGLTVVGFYFAAGADWKRWVSCLVGFATASLIARRMTRSVRQEAAHAPDAR